MAILTIARRFFLILAVIFWQGGFTFHSLVVVHVAHRVLGSRVEQGYITRIASDYMNLAGAVALATALTLAWPLASVVAVVDDNVAEAPVAGAAKVTETPLSGLLAASRTSTCSGTAKGARTVVLCGVPPVAWIEAGVPAVIVKALLCADTREVPTAVS